MNNYQKSVTRKVGVVEIGELDSSDADLLKWRREVYQVLDVCLYHKAKQIIGSVCESPKILFCSI